MPGRGGRATPSEGGIALSKTVVSHVVDARHDSCFGNAGRPMTRIHLIGGEKGGVGKSLVARLLAQYFIDRDVPFLGFDADRSHGALLRFYAGFASPVVVDRYESLDAIVEAALAEPGREVLVDLAAQTQEPLVRWIESASLLDLEAEAGFRFVYWHVMDSGRDSVDLLRSLLDRFGSRMSYVVVLNQVRGDAFSILEASGERSRAKELGARFVTIRKLQEAVANKLDARSASFWAAIHNTSETGPQLGLLERQRVKTWLRSAYEEVDRALA
jgi:hypothetical protein